MLKKRVIGVILDYHGTVVQSVKFKHTNTIHVDTKFAVDMFADWYVDEIIVLNVSKSPKSQTQFLDTLRHIAKHCFVPISAGGWVNNEKYAFELIRNGADKLVLNTALIENPKLVEDLCKHFGSQCIVGSIDGSYDGGKWHVRTNRGQNAVVVKPSDLAKAAEGLGVGELFYNCLENDGARRGYDLAGLTEIVKKTKIPLIAFGGVFSWKHLEQALDIGCDAVGVGNQFHYQEHAPLRAKKYLMELGFPVRF